MLLAIIKIYLLRQANKEVLYTIYTSEVIGLWEITLEGESTEPLVDTSGVPNEQSDKWGVKARS
jgi:hypothetical protein